MTLAYFWSFLTPLPLVSFCQTLNPPTMPWHTLPPFVNKFLQNFEETYVLYCISTKILSNKYNYKTLKNLFQVQRLSILVYAFVVIAAKYSFLLMSSLVKPPLPPMSGFVSISLTPPPP